MTPPAMPILARAIAGVLGIAAFAVPVAGAKEHGSQGRAIYIVQFEEPALASYTGPDQLDKRAPRLSATSPAVTGARMLDVKTPESQGYLAFLRDRREARLSEAEARLGRTLRPTHVYDVVFNGVALELEPHEAERLAQLPGVRQVEREQIERLHTDAGPGWIRADQVWSGAAGVTTRGEGVIVGVVDSGIHASHPSFAATSPLDGYVHVNPKGGFLGLCATGQATCNNKLIGIYNFTSEGSDGSDVSGHGTHVAGTVLGNPLNVTVSGVARTISGVAPRANLISYKACTNEGSSGSCPGSATLAALNQAATDQVHVVNYSIGGSANNPWSNSSANAMRGLRDAGVVVVVAAGNDGPGAGTVTSPGNAPWVLTVAAASHTRIIGNQLFLSGGATPPPNGGVLIGASQTGGSGTFPLVHAEPRLCAEGADTSLNGNNMPSAWGATTYSNRMVLCDRGIYARVDKSRNVKNAGGAAMVLLNQVSDGASVVADAHTIPSTHLRYADAQALLQWLSTGSGHTGRLDAATVRDAADFADVLAGFSGRGPAKPDNIAEVLKPNVTAPGVSILAADRTGSGVVFKSGTSMATPHVAGAAALLRAANPTWRANEIISALTTTARNSVKLTDGTTLAAPFDQGAGSIDVSRAIRAALSFNVTSAEFVNANPAAGGTPRDLNLPALVHASCLEACALTRRVTDLAGGGQWQVQFESLPDGVVASASPASFTLTAGATQSVNFSFDVSDPSLAGRWIHGTVRFKRITNDGRPDATIPVSLHVLPGQVPPPIELQVDSDAGFVDYPLSGLVALPDARFRGTPLAAPLITNFNLRQDSARNNVYDDLTDGVAYVTLTLPPSADGQPVSWKVVFEATGPASVDYDLYVGIDENGNSRPDASEERCRSTDPKGQARERCELDVQHPGGSENLVVWALVQNWESSSPGAVDTIRLEGYAVPRSPLGADLRGLTATGPGQVARNAPFNLRLSWNDPGMLPGDVRYGLVQISATRDFVTMEVPVRISRVAGTSAARALKDGETLRLRLSGNAAHERIYFEVPPNAQEVAFTLENAFGVDLYLAHVSEASSPQIGLAPPRNQAQTVLSGAHDSRSIILSGNHLKPGRWYLTPVNTRTTPSTEFALRARVLQSGPRPDLRSGQYYNWRRSGHGVFLDYAGSQWLMLWYTYLQDGTPTWYLAVAPALAGHEGVWNADLLRIVWNGNQTASTPVGRVQIIPTGTNTLDFHYQLDGQSGYEPMDRLGGGQGCPVFNGQALDVTGHWYSPDKSGFGYNVQLEPPGVIPNGLEILTAYLYDGQGFPRWLIGARDYDAGNAEASIAMEQLTGFCPLCTYQPTTSRIVGQGVRRYGTNRVERLGITAEFAPPLSGLWVESLPTAVLSEPKLCQ
ncbi:MAG: S8 family serine peptidase [Rehaibacterium terrae]|uniref:S8 family serine peptidase n=1 Tax=Rehaibacterium terrae TaxID=1341696 RepID=UPI00391A9896